MLTHEQTTELIAQAKNGDESAKTTLICENENLIRSILRRFKNKGESCEDLNEKCEEYFKEQNENALF